MPFACHVAGCSRRATTFGKYCNRHKSRNRRHGDPRQEGITTAVLKPYLKAVLRRIEKNPTSPAWGQLEARWNAAREWARAMIDDYHAGTPSHQPSRHAAQEILKVARDAHQSQVVNVVLAIYLLAESEPRRFRSDRAFRLQLVRRVRALSERNVATYWDHQRGRSKRVYRDFSPRAAEVMAEVLVEAFGVAGLWLARMEQAEAEARVNDDADYKRALEKLA